MYNTHNNFIFKSFNIGLIFLYNFINIKTLKYMPFLLLNNIFFIKLNGIGNW